MSVRPVANARWPGLDGLRALAVSAVVWHHAHPGLAGVPLSHHGFLGVDLFFALSGFLITALMLRERDSSGSVSLLRFYARRTLRIFPLYYAVLALLLLFVLRAPASSSQLAALRAELPYHATYSSNWIQTHSFMGITWSLSTEEQFYLVWPALFAWLGRRALWPALAFLVLNQAVNFGLLDAFLSGAGLPVAALPILQCTFTPILLGVLLAFALHHERLGALARRWLGTPATVLAAAVMLAAAGSSEDMRGLPRLAFHLASVFLLAGIVVRPRSMLARALEWRPLVYVGTVSYGIYLLHVFALDAVLRMATRLQIPPGLPRFALTWLLAVALASLSWRFFERPLLALKQRLQGSAADPSSAEPG